MDWATGGEQPARGQSKWLMRVRQPLTLERLLLLWTRRFSGLFQARQKHPPQAILAGGGLVYSTGLFFGVFWCFLDVFWLLVVPICPQKDFFSWFVGRWGVGRLGGSGRHTIGWVDCFGFFWKFGCFLVFWTAQDAAAGPCLVSRLS